MKNPHQEHEKPDNTFSKPSVLKVNNQTLVK